MPLLFRDSATSPRPLVVKLLLISATLLPFLALRQAHGQAYRYTASRKADLQLGGGVSVAKAGAGAGPDSSTYNSVHMIGFGLYGTYDFHPHFGVEVAFHQVNARNGFDAYERTYEVGGRYVYHLNRFHPYGRIMYGRGVFNFPHYPNTPVAANLAYNMAVGGAGLDVNVQKHINVRVDYEYEHWFGFPVSGSAFSLNPQLGTVGVAYHF